MEKKFLMWIDLIFYYNIRRERIECIRDSTANPVARCGTRLWYLSDTDPLIFLPLWISRGLVCCRVSNYVVSRVLSDRIYDWEREKCAIADNWSRNQENRIEVMSLLMSLRVRWRLFRLLIIHSLRRERLIVVFIVLARSPTIALGDNSPTCKSLSSFRSRELQQ